jgi:hypothetical protein
VLEPRADRGPRAFGLGLGVTAFGDGPGAQAIRAVGARLDLADERPP